MLPVQYLAVTAATAKTAGWGRAAPSWAVSATLPVLLANAALLAVLPNAEFLAIGAGTNPTTGATELILTRYFQ